jgi:hypothetical protein
VHPQPSVRVDRNGGRCAGQARGDAAAAGGGREDCGNDGRLAPRRLNKCWSRGGATALVSGSGARDVAC